MTYLLWSQKVLDASNGGSYKWRGNDHEEKLGMLDNLSHVCAGSQALWCFVPLMHTCVS